MRYVRVTGTVDARGRFAAGWWSAAPAEFAPVPVTDDGPAEWEAVALDEAGAVLSRVTAALAPRPVCPGGVQRRLDAVLGLPDDAASVAVRVGDVEVERRAVLAPAVVRVDAGPSRRLARTATVVDVDIDGPAAGPGAYLVARWTARGRAPTPLGIVPVTRDERPTLRVDLDMLPGGDGCGLVVDYFDGISRTTASLDDLVLEPRTPTPVITSPQPGAELLGGAWLSLVGRLEGEGEPDGLEWFVDDLPVGTGPSTGADAPPLGPHTIALRYGTASATVDVTVHPAPTSEILAPEWDPPWRGSLSARRTRRLFASPP